MKFHIEGMGLIGSLVAWVLHERNHEFTWNDTESEINCWKAGTGVSAPFNEAYDDWIDWCADDRFPWGDNLNSSELVELANYWFLSKRPPHKAKFGIFREHLPLRMGDIPSVHLNTQALVTRTREFFIDNRRPKYQEDATKIVAHGYTDQTERYLWGYSAAATVEYNESIHGCFGRRPNFYLRKGLYELYYVEPIPGTNFWYVGTSLINQKRAKELEVGPKLERAINKIHEFSNNTVRITGIRNIQEGWRPIAKNRNAPRWSIKNDEILLRPHGTDGMSAYPLLRRGLEYKIEEMLRR